jgi:hypothetical protein
MDLVGAAVGGGECGGQPAIGQVVDVDQSKIVILAVVAPTFRMIIILKPVGADDFRDRGKVLGRCRCTCGSLGLGFDRHQMAVVEVAGTILL